MTALGTSLSIASFSAALFVAACSSSNTPSGPAAPTPGTMADVEQALAARAKAYCDRVFGCCDAAAQSKLLQGFARGRLTREECEAGVTDYLQVARTDVAVALEREELSFFPSKEKACLAEEEARACDQVFALGASTAPAIACADAFTGKLEDGAPCRTGAVCKSTFCKIVEESGECAPPPAEGDPCPAVTDCGVGTNLYCARTSSAPSCSAVDGVCRARGDAPDGEPCCDARECAGQGCGQTSKGDRICTQNRLACDG